MSPGDGLVDGTDTPLVLAHNGLIRLHILQSEELTRNELFVVSLCFWERLDGGNRVMSSSMTESTPVSADELFQDLVLGFRTNPENAVTSVEKSRWCSDLTNGAGVSGELCDRLVNATAQQFRDDPALELTGGFDSRLVAALALAGGATLKRGFTIDVGEGDDVDRAREIASALRIEHRVVVPVISEKSALEDAFEFVRASGWRANCVNYGWLPSVYRTLEGFRTAQVGGVGGEIATGFYRSPLDRCYWMRGFFPLWCEWRVNRPSRVADRLYRSDAIKGFRSRHIDNVSRCFGLESISSETEWLDRCDRFYRDQRIASWAEAALAGSSRWYEPRMPLLSREYEQWAFEVQPRLRERKRQVNLAKECLASSQGQLAALFGARTPKEKSLPRRVRSLMNRIGLRSTTVPPVFSRYATVLARIPEFSRGVLRLARGEVGDLGLNERAIQSALCNPEQSSHELGALGTAAMSLGLIAG
jgi:hypothetical protein